FLDQHGADALLEEGQLLGRGGPVLGGPCGPGQPSCQQEAATEDQQARWTLHRGFLATVCNRVIEGYNPACGERWCRRAGPDWTVGAARSLKGPNCSLAVPAGRVESHSVSWSSISASRECDRVFLGGVFQDEHPIGLRAARGRNEFAGPHA